MQIIRTFKVIVAQQLEQKLKGHMQKASLPSIYMGQFWFSDALLSISCSVIHLEVLLVSSPVRGKRRQRKPQGVLGWFWWVGWRWPAGFLGLAALHPEGWRGSSASWTGPCWTAPSSAPIVESAGGQGILLWFKLVFISGGDVWGRNALRGGESKKDPGSGKCFRSKCNCMQMLVEGNATTRWKLNGDKWLQI